MVAVASGVRLSKSHEDLAGQSIETRADHWLWSWRGDAYALAGKLSKDMVLDWLKRYRDAEHDWERDRMRQFVYCCEFGDGSYLGWWISPVNGGHLIVESFDSKQNLIAWNAERGGTDVNCFAKFGN